MKRYLKIAFVWFIFLIVVDLITYLSISFILKEFNCFLWSENNRIGLIVFQCIYFCFTPLILFELGNNID